MKPVLSRLQRVDTIMKACLCFLLFLCIAAAAPAARAQLAPDTLKPALPIEIIVLYHKLRGLTPDYESLIRDNFIYQPAAGQPEPAVLLERQKAALEKIYDAAGPGTPILVKKILHVRSVDAKAHVIRFDPVQPDDAVVFPSLAGEKYGVFLRNAADLETLVAPFVFDEIIIFKELTDYQELDFPVELVVNPLAADASDFPLLSGETAHVILGEVTEIKIYHPQRDRLLMHKQIKVLEQKSDWSSSKLGITPTAPAIGIVPPLR